MAGNEVVIHVRADGHPDRDVDRMARKTDGNAKRSFGRVGTSSGLAFAAGFIKTITFGQVGSGFAQAATKLAPQAAAAGGVLGAGMAAGLIVQLTNALSAGLPLALGGALLAGPLMFLWKTQEKAVKRLKDRARDFIEFISQPVEVPFRKTLDAIGDGLQKISRPLRRMIGSIAPALEPLTKGVMKGIENFILAIEPAMPSVAAGMEAWAKAAPRIGRAMGQFLNRIMEDPEATVEAVENLTDSLIDLADAAGSIISGLQRGARAYGRFADTVDKQEGSIDKAMRGFNAAVRRGVSGAVTAIRSLASRAAPAFSRFASSARERFNSVVASGRRLASGIRSAASSVVSAVRSMMSRFASTVSSGASRVASLFRSLVSRIRGVFAGAGGWLVGAGRAIVNGLIAGIRGAAGAAASAAASVVRNAIARARSLIPGRAAGGPVWSEAAGGGARGGMVLVGERGPEVVQLPGGSHVFPNGNTAGMLQRAGKGGGDTYITVNAPNYVGSQSDLIRALVDAKRRGQLDVVFR